MRGSVNLKWNVGSLVEQEAAGAGHNTSDDDATVMGTSSSIHLKLKQLGPDVSSSVVWRVRIMFIKAVGSHNTTCIILVAVHLSPCSAVFTQITQY